MNAKSTVLSTHPTTTLSQRQANHWFAAQGGKESAPTTKPLDTPDHIEKRNKWVRKWFALLTDLLVPVAYLDEKWFYTTNFRRKIKRLPKSEEEEEGDDFIPQPKVRSRRFPIKAISMGVVGQTVEAKKQWTNFDGEGE